MVNSCHGTLPPLKKYAFVILKEIPSVYFQMKRANSVSGPKPILFLKIDSCACPHTEKTSELGGDTPQY